MEILLKAGVRGEQPAGNRATKVIIANNFCIILTIQNIIVFWWDYIISGCLCLNEIKANPAILTLLIWGVS